MVASEGTAQADIKSIRDQIKFISNFPDNDTTTKALSQTRTERLAALDRELQAAHRFQQTSCYPARTGGSPSTQAPEGAGE